MAHAIARSRHTLSVWARRAAATQTFVDAGAQAVASVAELGASCEIVCLCVTAEADVADVLMTQGLLRAMPRGAVLAIHSTISPAACRAFAADAARAGVELIDAPVSGGGDAARNGKLLVILGGEADIIARASPVLSCFGDRLVHVGPVGAAQSAKILNNLLFLSNFGAAIQALDIGKALNLDLHALHSVIAGSSGSSRALEAFDYLTTAKMAGEITPIMAKDLGLARDLARTHGFDITALEGAGAIALTRLADFIERHARGDDGLF